MLQLSDDLQAAIDEVEALQGELQVVLDDIARLVVKIDEGSANFFKMGASLARMSGDLRGNPMGVVLGEAAGVAALAGVVVKAGGWLYGEIKRRWTMAKLLPQKQRIARQRLGDVEAFIPRLESQATRFGAFVQQYAEVDIAPDALATFSPQWRGADSAIRSLHRVQSTRAYLEWVRDEFRAWLNGDHDSGQPPPSPDAVAEWLYQALSSSGDRVDDRVGTPLPLMAVYVAHLDNPSEELRKHGPYASIVRKLGRRRLRSLVLPFGRSAGDERALYAACLAGASRVAGRAWRDFGTLVLMGACVTGAHFELSRRDVFPEALQWSSHRAARHLGELPASTPANLEGLSSRVGSACDGRALGPCLDAARLLMGGTAPERSTAAAMLAQVCDGGYGAACASAATLRCREESEDGRTEAARLFERACVHGIAAACGYRCP